MSRNVALVLHLLLLAGQYLVPAFVTMTAEQHIAIATFLASVNAVLGLNAYSLNNDGTRAPQLDKSAMPAPAQAPIVVVAAPVAPAQPTDPPKAS